MSPKPRPSTGRSTRRRLLAALGAVGAGSALGASRLMGQVEAAAPEPNHQWAFVVDLRKCDGCEACTVACQKTHYLGPDQKWIKVYRLTDTTGHPYAMPRLCQHCENAPCVKVCPTAATFRNAEGVVLIDQNNCIGCRTCMAACPYEARYFNWDQPPAAPSTLNDPMPEFPVPQQRNTVGKCILCVHNTDVGKLPACVDACTMGALYIGDLKTNAATNGKETVELTSFLKDNDAEHFREELGTRPRVWYIAGHGQKLGL